MVEQNVGAGPFTQGQGLNEYGGVNPAAGDLRYELGTLGLQSDIIEKILNSPLGQQLNQQWQSGVSPDAMRMAGQQEQQYQNLMHQKPAYGKAETDRFKSLISGDFFTDDMAGSLRDRINRANQPKIQEAQAALAGRGLGTSAGEVAGMYGDITASQNRDFTDIGTQYLLDAISKGTLGLASADQQMLNRQQLGGVLAGDVRNFYETSRLNNLNAGINLYGMEQQNLLGLMGQSTGYRQYSQSQPSDLQSIGMGLMNVGMNYVAPGSGSAMNMFQEGTGNGTIGSGGSIGSYF